MQVNIDDKLYKDIADYCKLNNLQIKELLEILLKRGFMLEKYGESPFVQVINEDKKEECPKKKYIAPSLTIKDEENVVSVKPKKRKLN